MTHELSDHLSSFNPAVLPMPPATMPPPTLPPTPAASTEIAAKEHPTLPQLHRSFDLPPSAFPEPLDTTVNDPHRRPRPSTKKPSSAHASPAQPSQTPKSPTRKRTASQAALVPDDLSLPPPPSRSRKIIHMKPRKQDEKTTSAHDRDERSAGAEKATGGAGGKKKPAGPAAGRKIARKTAHSLIERRRRSKMNEEFGVLKDMIPACEGQEMHKLAILQASIEYMRYLQNCLANVKSGKQPASSATPSNPTRPQSAATTHSSSQLVSQDDEADGAERPYYQTRFPPERPEAFGSTQTSPAISAMATSPAFGGTSYNHARHRGSTAHFELPSPASAQVSSERGYAPYSSNAIRQSSYSHSNQASPTLLPQSSHSSAPSELDQEASAALLMLNASDRRTSGSGRNSEGLASKQAGQLRAISVKDLLSN